MRGDFCELVSTTADDMSASSRRMGIGSSDHEDHASTIRVTGVLMENIPLLPHQHAHAEPMMNEPAETLEGNQRSVYNFMIGTSDLIDRASCACMREWDVRA